MEAAAGFEPAHNGFAVRSLNHLGTPPYLGRTHSYTTLVVVAPAAGGSWLCCTTKAWAPLSVRTDAKVWRSMCGLIGRPTSSETFFRIMRKIVRRSRGLPARASA